ncbi:MAG: FAD-binding oxidoreductase [Eubacterium sp.]|nr:FAD-binding oxidoreductase [Candidatus Colimonas fimequi]
MIPVMNPTMDQLRDESGLHGTAEGILNPTNEADAQEMIRDYKDRGITFQGTRTGICGGSVPEGGVIIGTAWMKWVWDRQEDGDDILAHVGAGVTLDQLDTALRKDYKGYIWPPRPTEVTATVGGVVALGSKGINAVHYGETRNYVAGVKLIDNDGELQTITDPDELDKIVGSEGKMGLITDVTVRLVKKPEATWGVGLFFEDEMKAAECAQEMKTLFDGNPSVFLTGNEFIDRDGMNLVDEFREQSDAIASVPAFPEGAQAMLYVEISGQMSQMMPSLMPIIQCSSKYGSDPNTSWAQTSEAGVDQLHAVRHAVAEGSNVRIAQARIQDESIVKLGVDIARPDADFAKVLADYREDLNNTNVASVVFGHVYNNNLHVNLLPKDKAEYDEAYELMKKWVAKAVSEEAEVFDEHGLGRIKADLLP